MTGDGPGLDLLVLGSGVAGLSAAVRAADALGMRVGVLTKGELDQAATRWAQGGVAAVLGGDPDSTDLHLADTLAAGAGLCDVDAVRVLVDEGPGRVNELIALGAVFDRDHDGRLAARPGGRPLAAAGRARRRRGHRRRDRAGARRRRSREPPPRSASAGSLSTSSSRAGRCRGVTALDADGVVREVRAHARARSPPAAPASCSRSRPTRSRRRATVWRWRCAPGSPCADVEFVQFHPTALAPPGMPRPLLSEALRGHGALLRDAKGERFVDELLPRDAVSRAMTARMLEQDVDHCWLDATGLEHFDERFPTIAAAAAAGRARPGDRLVADRARGPLPVRRHRHRPRRRDVAAGAVGGRRGRVHGRARRQPARFELAARRAWCSGLA